MANKMFIVSHGLHTGVTLDKKHVTERIPFLANYFSDCPLVEFGWGDEKYYRADKVTLVLTARSILFPTDSVLHVTGIPDHPEKYSDRCDVVEIHTDKKGLDDISDFISSSFKLNDMDEPEQLTAGIDGNESYFFRANGKYHAFNTCNVWTAKALKASGFPIHPFLKLTSRSIMKQIKK